MKTPPHLFKDKQNIKMGFNLLDFKVINEKLLPFPYKTNCYDYEIGLNAYNRYQSKEECIVKNLQIREYRKL